jgi:hypothetical protein
MQKDRTLADTMKRVERRIEEASGQNCQLPLQFPLWGNQVRGIPNQFVRSALFRPAGKNEERARFNREIMASLAGFKLGYTGEELRQDDEDVFLQAVHLARLMPPGEDVEITGHQFLKALKWGVGAKDYTRLKESMFRLKEAVVWITTASEKHVYGENLIASLEFEQQDNVGIKTSWTFNLNPKIVGLFTRDNYTLIDWEHRLALPPLAKWLHSFYSTHRDPYPYKVQKLHELCGSKCKELRAFRFLLKKALNKLQDNGFLTWDYDEAADTIIVTRAKKITNG